MSIKLQVAFFDMSHREKHYKNLRFSLHSTSVKIVVGLEIPLSLHVSYNSIFTFPKFSQSPSHSQ